MIKLPLNTALLADILLVFIDPLNCKILSDDLISSQLIYVIERKIVFQRAVLPMWYIVCLRFLTKLQYLDLSTFKDRRQKKRSKRICLHEPNLTLT